jgi:hypothetical protein
LVGHCLGATIQRKVAGNTMKPYLLPPMRHSLEVFSGESLVFSSDQNWLHPIFELEIFLTENSYEPADLLLRDRILGKAAALLVIRLGIRRVVAEIMSKLGLEALERHGIQYEYDSLVDRIICRTEELLRDEMDPDRAYELVRSLKQD